MLFQYDLDFEPVFRRSDEVIGIADLLMRWPHNSFYHISYLAGLERFVELDTPRLHMRLARRIGLDKETNKIILYLQNLDRWMHMENAFANFDMLYFDLEEVKELEKNHIEHRIIDLERRNLDPLEVRPASRPEIDDLKENNPTHPLRRGASVKFWRA